MFLQSFCCPGVSYSKYTVSTTPMPDSTSTNLRPSYARTVPKVATQTCQATWHCASITGARTVKHTDAVSGGQATQYHGCPKSSTHRHVCTYVPRTPPPPPTPALHWRLPTPLHFKQEALARSCTCNVSSPETNHTPLTSGCNHMQLYMECPSNHACKHSQHVNSVLQGCWMMFL